MRHALRGRDQACAKIGEVGAQHFGGADGLARTNGAAQDNGPAEELARGRHEGEPGERTGVATRAS
jgi:hypothetical protein